MTFDEDCGIHQRVISAVLLLCAITLICYLPWRSLDKYHRYLNMHPGAVDLAKRKDFGRSLVLVRGIEHPDYQSAWIYNPVNFEGDAPIYAWDKSPELRRELLRAYSDRPVWIIEGPTLTGGKYRILRGPVSANELIREDDF